MIVFENRTWQRDSNNPNGNYLEGIDCEQPKWVMDDNSEVAAKVMSYQCWEPVEDDKGQLVDVVFVKPPETDAEKRIALKSQLEELDRQAIRPLRAIAAGNATDEDREILTDLEQQAAELRQRLAALEK